MVFHKNFYSIDNALTFLPAGTQEVFLFSTIKGNDQKQYCSSTASLLFPSENIKTANVMRFDQKDFIFVILADIAIHQLTSSEAQVVNALIGCGIGG